MCYVEVASPASTLHLRWTGRRVCIRSLLLHRCPAPRRLCKKPKFHIFKQPRFFSFQRLPYRHKPASPPLAPRSFAKLLLAEQPCRKDSLSPLFTVSSRVLVSAQAKTMFPPGPAIFSLCWLPIVRMQLQPRSGATIFSFSRLPSCVYGDARFQSPFFFFFNADCTLQRYLPTAKLILEAVIRGCGMS